MRPMECDERAQARAGTEVRHRGQAPRAGIEARHRGQAPRPGTNGRRRGHATMAGRGRALGAGGEGGKRRGLWWRGRWHATSAGVTSEGRRARAGEGRHRGQVKGGAEGRRAVMGRDPAGMGRVGRHAVVAMAHALRACLASRSLILAVSSLQMPATPGARRSSGCGSNLLGHEPAVPGGGAW